MRILFISFLTLFFSANVIAATYVFQGSQYQTVYGDNYTTQMRLTGNMVTSQVLTPDMSSSQILTLIESFSFNDGVQTLTQNNSEFIQFYMSADNDGLPFAWDLRVARTPVADEVGELFDVIHFFFSLNTEGFDEVQHVSSEPCSGLYLGICDSSNGMTNSGIFNASPSLNRNQWTLLGGNGVQAVPINQFYFLLLLGLLTLLITHYVLKKNHGDNH